MVREGMEQRGRRGGIDTRTNLRLLSTTNTMRLGRKGDKEHLGRKKETHWDRSTRIKEGKARLWATVGDKIIDNWEEGYSTLVHSGESSAGLHSAVIDP